MNRILGPLVILLALLLGGVVAFWLLAPRSGGPGGLGGVAGGPGGDGQDGGSDEPAPLDPLASVEAPTEEVEESDASGSAPHHAGLRGDGGNDPGDPDDGDDGEDDDQASRPGVRLKLVLAGGGEIDKAVEGQGTWVVGTDDQPSMEWIGVEFFAGEAGAEPMRLSVPDGAHPRGDGKTLRLQLRISGGPYRIANAGRAGAFLDVSEEVQIVTLELLPSIRLEVLDAVTRAPLESITVRQGYVEPTDRPGWFRLFRPSGANDVTLSSAKRYVPQRVTLTLPERGVVDHATPFLLERGLLLSGKTARATAIWSPVTAVAERTDGDPKQPVFLLATTTQTGRWSFAPLPAGSYRVMWFSKGNAPLAEQIELSEDQTERIVKLDPLAAGASANPRPYRWADRKHIKFPLSVDGLNGLEIIQWVEEILGAPIRRTAEVDAKLKEIQLSVSFTDLPVISALQMFAQFSNFEFDTETGAFTRPSEKK